ncbi:hypothetical protein [Azorhizobium doebereinerae]|nr:hypothetical protein [Azorhizobium doebereinerae]
MRSATVIQFQPRLRPMPSPVVLGLLWWATSIQIAMLPLAVAAALTKREC